MEGARGILSCSSCRQRKLKCDRLDPCGNCVSRNVDCHYATFPSRARDAARRGNNQQLEARLRRLEQVIESMGAQKTERESTVEDGPGNFERSQDGSLSTGSPGSGTWSLEPGRILTNSTQTTYVSGSHWASVVAEVADMREQFDQVKVTENEHAPDPTRGAVPMLLRGPQGPWDLQEVLADIPPKDAADRLVSRYINATNVSFAILHTPTFEREYRNFWRDPQAVTTIWLGLLYAVMGMGAISFLRSQEPLPAPLGDHHKVIEILQQRSTECLLAAKYSTAPGPYTLEALMLNAQNEYLRTQNSQLGVWILAGIGTRLALHMGYHRDSSAYPQISAFDGEMRRRVWACVKFLDALFSYQMGLPSMIHDSQCDTKLPRNLLDEDFGPDSTELPPARPVTELTPVLYTISKSRLATVFGEIYNQVSQGRTEAYEEIMALDHRLRAAQQAIPSHFQMATLSDSITVTPYLLIRRYTFDLLFQKSLCILHRQFMVKSIHDDKFNVSRSACVDAAMAILTHQANIHKEMQLGGLLHHNRWIVSTLQQTDFLLASMIVGLELSLRSRTPKYLSGPVSDDMRFLRFSDGDLVQALQRFNAYLLEMKLNSRECELAFNILAVILDRFSNNVDEHTGQGNIMDHSISSGHAPPEGPSQWNPSQSFYQPHTAPYLESIEEFLSGPNMADWESWEELVRSPRGPE